MEMKEKAIFRSCGTDEDSQDYLLECIKHNDLSEIKILLEEDRININHFYGHPYYKTALSTACQWFTDTITPDCIQLLLKYGADPLLEDDEEKNTINYAAEGSNEKLLEPILNYLKDKDYNFQDLTVMFPLLEHIKNEIYESNRKENDYVNVVKLLLEFGIDINRANDHNGQTAVYIAADYGFKHIVTVILKNDHVNLDKYKNKRTNKTARDLILEQKLFDGELPDVCDENENTTTETLFKNLREKKTDEFKKNYTEIENVITQENKNKLLNMAVEKGLDEAVKYLLDKGGDSDSVKNDTLLEKATDRGYFKIVKLLIRKNPNPATVANSLLVLSKVKDTTRQTPNINFNKCLDLLLRYKELKINYKDPLSGKTALHIAAKYQQPEMVLKLLHKGASLASTDTFDIQPIADINAETLKTHLDECIEESQNYSNDDENKNLTIKVTSLLPPRPNTELVDNEENCKVNVENQPLVDGPVELLLETSVLQYMSKSQELKHLLTHPVIMTFLYLKWYHIRLFFYINLGIYLTFFGSLLTYIMLGYNHLTHNDHPVILNISYIILFITFTSLLFREIGQIVIYKTRYFLSFENWLEIILLLVTAIILIRHSEGTTIRQLSAVAIVLSAIELLLLIGQFPSLSTNIMMLRTVSYTFFKLLLWYSILLLAFAFSFYTLFQENGEQNNNKNETKTEEDEEEQNFFLDPGMSLLKTIVMLTGEFDAASIKFNSYPIISHLIFVSFVFLIAIVLFNLLNGLAVSDTQIIKNDAVLYDQILRVEHIGHLERVLLKNKFIHWFPFINNICLFPSNVTRTEIKIYENQNYKITFGDNEESNRGRCYQCQEVSLGKKIQRAIRNLLQENREEEIRRQREDELNKKLKDMIKQLDNLQSMLANK